MSSTDDRHAWTRPEPETVAPGVVRVALPLPLDALRAVNVYVLVPADPADGLTLVDGGWALAESRDLLRSALRGLGADLGDVRRFLVTHVHRDHYTQAVALRREVGARVGLGRGEEGSLRVVAERAPAFVGQVAALRTAGAGALADLVGTEVVPMDDAEREDFAAPDDWFADGDVLDVAGHRLVALETPGHTRGHLVYSDDGGPGGDLGGGDAARPAALFAGDHVLPHITPSIGFEPDAAPGALRRYLDSLAKVRELPDRRLYPAHGPVGESVHARVDELLDHHGHRLDEIATRVERGAATAHEVAAGLTWTRHEKGLDDLETFHRMLAVLETDAHLEVLAAQGRVERTVVDGVAVHRADAGRD